MKKLRVGVWLNNTIKPQDGGGFGYYTQLIDKLNSYTFKDAEIIFLSNVSFEDDLPFKHYSVRWKPSRFKKIRLLFVRILSISTLFSSLQNLLKSIDANQDGKLKSELYQVADLIYYPFPECIYPCFPYIYTLWDLGHLSMFAFPEVNTNEVFENRESFHRHLIEKALMIFTESDTGKKDVQKYYNMNADRIRIVPLFPSTVIDKNRISRKPEKIEDGCFFIHYPAQFWPHKNHYNLLIAFSKLVKEFPSLKLIFTGSDKGNKEYLFQTIKQMGLTDDVVDLGFISNEELKWMYRHSQGLVMPTFLGPTNMPLLEAAELACPVACSNLPGHIEQLGEYGYYFNPLCPDDIHHQIRLMITDKKNHQIKPYDSRFNMDAAMLSIDAAFSDLRNIRFCWGQE